MKKNILPLMVAVIALVLPGGNVNAQLSRSSEAVAGISTPGSQYLKKSSSPVAISFRTLKTFNRMFPSTDGAWYEISDAYIAKFSSNSVETMVGYAKRGRWLYTIKRYGEKNLPKDVREQVKMQYFDYKISHIDEVHVPGQENSIYIIHIRDDKNFKTLRVCDRDMEVIAEYHE